MSLTLEEQVTLLTEKLKQQHLAMWRLKAPLSTIHGLASDIIENRYTHEETLEYVMVIKNCANSMFELIDNSYKS